MDEIARLGEFLRTRRAQLRPEDVGVPTYGERRRVPGLRRDELARLAGVSSSYYTRLEQGHSTGASAEVLDALATALRLDDDERRHLHTLARPVRPARRRRPAPERVGEATGELLAALEDVPALALGRRTDVLAWNRLGHALFAGHLDFGAVDDPARRPNMARLVFLDPHSRDLYPDWPVKARAAVGNLRMIAAQHPDDASLYELVGELSSTSAEFASMWADHRVRPCATAVYGMRHPVVGSLTVTQQTLTNGTGTCVVIATTEQGSPSQAALSLLAQAAAESSARVSRTGGRVR
ncbi:Transcriptional regulator, contains XRE-family HTH domain [Lentzea fradiae]|uniref:Transcriptional regulator, contains XRE-family HTH domain n=1 Tax=Lentzea fradiae TaxID=200378 RepID=A0A1G7KNP9_9PSEU|nr:helix-turn-helix transcriptional regulator [Lentzea fradiae]SDF38399.1 Transcriptional regulator, contains XRE-family HTH domain [Lentzea fradiae]